MEAVEEGTEGNRRREERRGKREKIASTRRQ